MVIAPRIHTVIVAAGSGSRFGSALPKQFCDLAGRPVLMHTVDAFRKAFPAGNIVIVLSREMSAFWHELCLRHGYDSPAVAFGGRTRWHSVRNALDSLDAAPDDIILVHDGARPVVDTTMCRRLTDAAIRSGAAIPVMPLSESIRRVDADGNSTAEDRSRYLSVQTPQAFNARVLLSSYARPRKDTFTDDASVVEDAAHSVSLVEGSPHNIKITYPDDIRVAEIYLESLS